MVTVVGGGLAGVEASWAAAELGQDVTLYEMRPVRMTPAHKTDRLAELVCSNSFKSQNPDSPAGLLKAEMEALGSIVIPAGRSASVPGGEALAVDRDLFAAAVTAKIGSHPRIKLVREPFVPDLAAEALKQGPLIIATGPLTTQELADWLSQATGQDRLHFYDAVSPTVEATSLDREIVFAQSRYDKGEGDDYLNCPFNKEEYFAFVDELITAPRAPIHEFEEDADEKIKYFAGCMPIEAIAEKGRDSLRFGNFKPVGLTDPRTGRRPYAALQLRPENRDKTLYSLVACQTRLKWGEQKRVLQMVPGLGQAEFVRFGVIHKNTYIEAPKVLKPTLELNDLPGVFIAGQLTGVEGYIESAAMGILAGLNAARMVIGKSGLVPPPASALGSLIGHLQDQTPRDFAPMNVNWGLLPENGEPARDKGVRRAQKLASARTEFANWMAKALD